MFDEQSERLFREMAETERSSQLLSFEKAITTQRNEFIRDLSNSRLPVLLDEIAAKEYEERAASVLSLAIRLSSELEVVWTPANAENAKNQIFSELIKDWDQIDGVLQKASNETAGRVPVILGQAKVRTVSRIEQEISLLVLWADRSRIPVADRLLADRYSDVSAGWQAAHRHFTSVDRDLASAVKEAVGAVETLARIVVKDPSVTLGKAILILRSGDRVKAPLLKGIEELWGWSSGGQAAEGRHIPDSQSQQWCTRRELG